MASLKPVWSLKQGLAFYQEHLPSGFDATKGIRSLFPPKYTGSIAPLKKYVYATYARLGTVYNFGPTDNYIGAEGDFYVMADATGRWFFSWDWWPISTNPSYLRQAGFVFKFSNDGSGHGFVDTSHPSPETKSCSSGTDKWIADNWPQILTAPARITFQEGTSFDTAQIWSGFRGLTHLSGANCACASTLSGSTLFQYPNAAVRQPSALATILASAVQTAGHLIQQSLSKIPKTFVSKGGLTFVTSIPAGYKAGDAGTIKVTFSSADNKTQGSFTYTTPGDTEEAAGTIDVKVSNGSATINYTYTNHAAASQTPLGQLDYTVSFTGNDKSKSSFKQTVVDGLVTTQTSTVTAANGTSSTTTVTYNSNGTVTVSGSNPPPASAAAVANSAAEKVASLSNVIGPTANLMGELLALTGSSSSPITFTDGDLTFKVSSETASDGTPQSYTITYSTDVSNPVSIVGAFTIDATTGSIAGGTSAQFTYNGEDYSMSVTASGGSVTSTMTISGAEGTTTSTMTTVDGTVTGQSSTATDNDQNTSTSSVTFNSDGSSTLTITTTDSDGNGTTETIDIDADGNVTGDTTGTTGDEGSGTSADDGATVSGDTDDGDDDGDGDDGGGGGGGSVSGGDGIAQN